ncbi:predicted protein [Uncinocarpus reesii 1704]|uniref:Uncharacterized protein n=1 Tax=Uncinocarpus reesii (strain UAMH 1704) TaxID=336963 RepID=C4JZN5_UNCRE|nr:uncharacterized protein UREG_07636 [Uncinocarpus reesii 1704]EEP82771.1 predicted protein [Uncinocarpus reesii 1704]
MSDSSSGIELDDDDDQLTILGCRLSTEMTYNYFDHTFYTSFEEPRKYAFQGREPDVLDIWRPNGNLSKLPLSHREAIIVSALLFLDTLGGDSSSILSKPFPENSSPPRYPAVYLDYDFLSAVKESPMDVSAALGVLRKQVTLVPAEILRDLSSSLLNKVGKVSNPRDLGVLQSTACRLAALMANCDRPELAIDADIHILKSMPDASSWHRLVMSMGLVKNLDYAVAENLFAKISSFVLDSHRKWQQKRLQGDQVSNDTTLQPIPPSEESNATKHVKITTIKLLVQLISDAGFFSSRTSLQTLAELFTHTHIDVRHAVIAALFELLNKSVRLDGKASADVYATVAPFHAVAAGPSEYATYSEADWANAEKGGPLPTIDSNRPLLFLFTVTRP